MKLLFFALLLLGTTLWSCVYAGTNSQPDNTANNVRDRNNVNPTPDDQSNTKCALKTTAKLRREIMRTKGLSIDAQNIKIISQNGCVILRGPVDSEEEKNTINDLARNCCGGGVVNELEVKAR